MAVYQQVPPATHARLESKRLFSLDRPVSLDLQLGKRAGMGVISNYKDVQLFDSRDEWHLAWLFALNRTIPPSCAVR